MRPYTSQLLAAALATVVCLLLVVGCNSASRPHSVVVADSVSEFSGTQGAHGWSYGYWDRSADTDKRYDQATDFQLLKHFGSDPINQISGRSEFTVGELWNLQDGRYFTSLWAEGGHPNGTMELGAYAQVEQWAVRRWVSTIDGPVTISGHAGKVMPWGENWGGGVRTLILVDGKELYSADIEDGGSDYSIEAKVQVGSLVDFLIGPNPSVGVIEFTGTIRTAPDLRSVVDEVAERATGEGKVVGLVVVVARNAEVVFERGYGRADVETDEPMTGEAVLDYFSIGKHITAAILLRLAERGELDLEASARLYLPEADFEGYDVTTRQLLSHTSGLWEAEQDENELPDYYRDPPPDGAILAWANQGERLAAPGETWMYSGGGFLFAGEIAERLSGRTLEQLIDKELAEPLGLQNFRGCADVKRDRAPAYFVEAGETRRIAEVDPEWFGGAGTVCGTAGDLMRWWLALQSGRVVNAGSLEQLLTPTRLRRNGIEADSGYGLGVRLGEYAGYRKIGHTGSGSGGTSVLAEYPDAGLAILVITNTAGDGVRNAYDVEAEIASALLGADTRSVAETRIPDELLRAAPGLYRSPLGRMCVSARGAELWRSFGDTAPERLRHVGAGRFVAADDAHGSGVEYFLGIGSGGAQWFAYDRHGFPDDLAIRVDDDCR